MMAILSCNFFSKSLGRMISFQAVIPTMCFTDMLNPHSEPYAKQESFQTLYLLHGIGGNDTDWLVGSRVAHYAEEHNIVVIMPAGENSFYTDNNNTDRYGEFIGKELVEVTRRMFNLSHEREKTYIGGLSMGGYGALRNGLKYNDTFGKIIALSPALVANDAIKSTNESFWAFGKRDYFERIFGDLDKLEGSDLDIFALALKNARNTQIYFACGTEDTLLSKSRELRDFLEKNNIPFEYEEGTGGHDWKFWDTYIEKGICKISN